VVTQKILAKLAELKARGDIRCCHCS
jgi:hypothetical protein